MTTFEVKVQEQLVWHFSFQEDCFLIPERGLDQGTVESDLADDQVS